MIDFLKARFACAIFSVVIICSFFGVFFYKLYTQGHAFEYSIDFTGGTSALLKFEKPVSTLEVKKILENVGYKDFTTRDFSATEVLVRTKEHEADAKGLAEKMREQIASALPNNIVELLQCEAVGKSVGEVLRAKSVYAIFFSILAILLYIAFSFWSFAFGFGAVVALIHDTIVMLFVCMFFGREISMTVIGAILALLGYSNNDTIVIFSQIRKNLKSMRGARLYDIVNTSLNQVLRRTLLTSSATALVVISMLIFGGETLRDFSLILLVGIAFGTYSSIYIASPIMMLFYREK